MPRSRIMTTDLLRRWREEPCYRFSDWPNDAAPQVAAGVCTIWRDEQLVYVGMAGRSLTAECIAAERPANGRGKGLFSRSAP
jgi:hypothetical protein